MKKTVYLILILFSIILFSLTIRGNAGIPNPDQIEASHKLNKGPFESSQESSRYAILLSLYNDNSRTLDKYPFLGTPDLGYLNGHYYSFFPPTLSFIAIPFYILGLYMGATQLSVFAMLSVFSILTMCLIVKFCQKLDLHWSIALFSAVAFGFATNAWGYSVTFYSHLVSAFLLLLAIYMTVFGKGKSDVLRLCSFWVIYGLAVYLDYPNLITYLPIALAITFQGISLEKNQSKLKINFSWKYFLAPFIFIAMLIVYGFYNYSNFGNPLQMSNTLPRVNDISKVISKTTEVAKGSVPALQTRSLLEGFHSFLISSDRGILIFSPVVLLFVFGVSLLKKKKSYILGLFLAVVGINLLQYSMFGDPYGGWAFGSRYMIAVFPELCILAGFGLAKYSKNILIKVIYTLVFLYSLAVSLLAPLTTNVIPPLIEAKNAGLDATYLNNINLILKNDLNSFFYNHILNKSIPAIYYYFFILVIVFSCATTMIWWKRKEQ